MTLQVFIYIMNTTCNSMFVSNRSWTSSGQLFRVLQMNVPRNRENLKLCTKYLQFLLNLRSSTSSQHLKFVSPNLRIFFRFLDFFGLTTSIFFWGTKVWCVQVFLNILLWNQRISMLRLKYGRSTGEWTFKHSYSLVKAT